jgi:hypothetical protein
VYTSGDQLNTGEMVRPCTIRREDVDYKNFSGKRERIRFKETSMRECGLRLGPVAGVYERVCENVNYDWDLWQVCMNEYVRMWIRLGPVAGVYERVRMWITTGTCGRCV